MYTYVIMLVITLIAITIVGLVIVFTRKTDIDDPTRTSGDVDDHLQQLTQQIQELEVAIQGAQEAFVVLSA
jgi:CHASE1-domain containing sensor protein